MPSRLFLGVVCLAFCLEVEAKDNNNVAKTYRDAARKLMDAALADEAGYEKLTYLCDRIGNRLSGSDNISQPSPERVHSDCC